MSRPGGQELRVVDSHTGGEPTRVVIEGGPELGSGPLAERVERLRREHDRFRRAVVTEPRGSDALVGALLVEPTDPSCAAGVIYFNNAGPLGMCVHGTIGLVTTLAHLGRIGEGEQRIETPVGVVAARLEPDGSVSVENVESHRAARGVELEVEGVGAVRGDVAWGGNGFFITGDAREELTLPNAERLRRAALAIRRAIEARGLRGDGDWPVDHVALVGPPGSGGDGRSFTLCSGGAFDRSPCGTGTSARLACLAADGELAEGEAWRQEGILGTIFEASWRRGERGIVPRVRGRAWITLEGMLRRRADDPFRDGIGPIGSGS